MKIVVTGGAGFIGSDFIRYTLLRHPEDRIVCIDKLTYAGEFSDIQERVHPNFRFIRADICDHAAMERVFLEEKPDVVINFAAESHVDRSIHDPQIFFRTNVIGTAVLLDVSLATGVKRFHQVSTDEVYGSLAAGEKPWTESAPLASGNPYAASKASADLTVLSYANTYGMSVTISRSCNNYGPWQYVEKLIPRTIVNALTDRKLPVYGTGEQRRSWLYVRDHVCAIDLVVRHGKSGEIYNVGSEEELCNLALVEQICEMLGISSGRIEHVADRKGHDSRYALDCGKIKGLGWRAEMNLTDGLAETIDWYVNNRKRWERLV